MPAFDDGALPARLIDPLTTRESAVLALLPRRMTVFEIARQLGISTNTVKTHVKHIYMKLGVERRRAAISVAERHGLLETSDSNPAADGGTCPSCGTPERRRADDDATALSEREGEVARLLVAPLTIAEIGRHLDIAPNTAKTHVRLIYRKIGVNSRLDAVRRLEELRSGGRCCGSA
jgi:DNA-binding CsgD family transcriptional regulator